MRVCMAQLVQENGHEPALQTTQWSVCLNVTTIALQPKTNLGAAASPVTRAWRYALESAEIGRHTKGHGRGAHIILRLGNPRCTSVGNVDTCVLCQRKQDAPPHLRPPRPNSRAHAEIRIALTYTEATTQDQQVLVTCKNEA